VQNQAARASLSHSLEALKTELETLRSDYSLQQNEQRAELEALRQMLQKAGQEASALQLEISGLKRDNKQLKSQNLALQHRLNQWGIPVWSGNRADGDPDSSGNDAKAFFPTLTALQGSEDPVPVILRGELSVLPFPDLLSFLATSRLDGVVTVVTEGPMVKLYLENSVIRLAGWNNPDPELKLLKFLLESDLLLQQDPQLVPASSTENQGPGEREAAAQEILSPFQHLELYDLDLATKLVADAGVPAATMRKALREHAKMILEYLFRVDSGAFFFQSGRVAQKRELQFELFVTDALLKTAAQIDELTRALEGLTGR
jgi:hypothetical protein